LAARGGEAAADGTRRQPDHERRRAAHRQPRASEPGEEPGGSPRAADRAAPARGTAAADPPTYPAGRGCARAAVVVEETPRRPEGVAAPRRRRLRVALRNRQCKRAAARALAQN